MIFRKIKRNALIIVLSVIILSILTIKVTYSYIFSVQGTTNVQTFTAGTLNVSISSSKMMSAKLMMPSPSSSYPTVSTSAPKEDENASYATLVLDNSASNLNAKFTVGLDLDIPSGKAESDCVDLRYLKIGVYDATSSNWLNLSTSGAATYSATVTSFTKGTNGYPIFSGVVSATASHTYRIYVWLIDTTPESQIGKYVHLKLNVSSVPDNQA